LGKKSPENDQRGEDAVSAVWEAREELFWKKAARQTREAAEV
jgi:hypothetical protein